MSPVRTFLTTESSLDGTPRREAGLDTLVPEPDTLIGGLGRLLAVLLVRTAGVPGSPHYPVRQLTTRIGREGVGGLVLAHPSVSSEHAELRLRGGVWTLTDLGSLNGSWVDGEPVLGSLPLAPGSEVRLGEVVMVFNPRDRWQDSVPDAAPEPRLIGPDASETPAIAAPAAMPAAPRPRDPVVFGAFDSLNLPASRSRTTAVWVTVGIVAVLLVVFLLLQAR